MLVGSGRQSWPLATTAYSFDLGSNLARHTGLAVARTTTWAQTMNREWSSMPVTTLAHRRDSRPGHLPAWCSWGPGRVV